MSLFAWVVLVQIIAAGVVFAVLRAVLNGMLIDLALKHREVFRSEDGEAPVDRVVIVSFRPLKDADARRARRAVDQRIRPAGPLEFQVERQLWGGVVIRAGSRVLDFSLRDRLKRAL